MLFSIEPALYLPDFGVLTEINLFAEDRSILVTGRMQNTFLTSETVAVASATNL